jgi:group I intron endonuclease
MRIASGGIVPKIQGIYEIRNIVSGRVYVGSSHDIIYRFRKHRERLNGGYHSSLRFQASWKKHGQDAFTFTVLEVVAQRSDLLVREQHWIDALDATNPERGLNVRGTAEGTLGFQHTPEAVARIRAAGLGRKHTPEAKAKMSAIRKSGPKRTLSEAHKAAIRASSKVWAGTPENRAKVSQLKAGRVVSEETKKRQSIALTGRIVSDAAKEKLRLANLGKKRRRPSAEETHQMALPLHSHS